MGAVDWDHLLFTDQDLKKLLWPLIAEQLLNSLMGMMDTMMVSRVGSAAISAVSLVDAINTLFIQIFAAMATGGTILCSQYLGAGDRKQSNSAAQQIALSSLVITAACAVFSIAFRRPLLRVTFGSVEPLVMQDSLDYFLLTAASYPFIGMFQVGSAFYRAGGNSRFPMTISVISNILNIIGNAIFIFGMNMGVTGAALSTLLSRIYAMIVVFAYLRMPRQEIVLRDYFRIRPDWSMIGRVLSVGIPSGVENGMFQFGKLAIQSSVSTLGTTAIAAQAMAAILEGLNGIAGIGIGIGLMTVVGRGSQILYRPSQRDWICSGRALMSCPLLLRAADHFPCRHGAGSCFHVHFHDGLDFRRQTDRMGPGLYTGIRTSRRRRCPILHGYGKHRHVGLQRSYPCLRGRSDCGLDRYVFRLDPSRHLLYAALFFRKVAPACPYQLMPGLDAGTKA